MTHKRGNRPILVPVDFSDYSRAALLQASELSACLGQPIVVLHVVHDPADMPGYYSRVTKKKKIAHIQDLAKEAFDQFISETLAQHPNIGQLQHAKTRLVMGLPVSRILEMIDKTGASMVVMGSQGRTGMRHIMLGSKAEQIVRLSPVPVLIVKNPIKAAKA
ncbi:MAG: universal stress protein [Gammaproteobacteria bacterium]|nr:universal stress protein [Gammaproteobacteria bacterium]